MKHMTFPIAGVPFLGIENFWFRTLMRPPKRMRFIGAFTLIELLVVIAIIAILATLVAPSFQDLIKTNQVTSQNNEIVSLITLARSEAIRRSANVQIVFTAPDESQWNAIIRVPNSDNVLRSASSSGVQLIEGKILSFNSRGYLIENNGGWTAEILELKHPNCTNPRQRRLITVQRTGQVDSVNSVACQ